MTDNPTERSTGVETAGDPVQWTSGPGDLTQYDRGHFDDITVEWPTHPAVEHAAKMLAALGFDVDDRTPYRLVAALDELAAGRSIDPRRHLAVRFPGVATPRELQQTLATEPQLVAATDLPFSSVCEHHILPFHGIATVAYVPKTGGEIVGLSKMGRLVREYAARPQVQERLVHQVLSALMDELSPLGAAVAVRGYHSCMSLRGACTGTAAGMVVIQRAGDLAEDPWRSDFSGLLTTAAWR